MLNITLVAIGPLKADYCQSAWTEYVKRLKPYARLRLVELAPASFSKTSQAKAKEMESQRLEDFLVEATKKEQRPVYLLAERGRSFTSPELADWFGRNQSIILVIGGALGFSPRLYGLYPQISLSPLTFPHELARVLLLEQLYRSVTILNKKEYHY